MLLCAAVILLTPQHAAQLISVQPRVLPTSGSTLYLTGGGSGGLLAGTQWAGNFN
jgi:hypothetical protein